MKLPGLEVTVSKWAELMEELHTSARIPRRTNEGNHLRSPYIFRGVDDSSWGLQTSLQRLAGVDRHNIDLLENALIRSFRKYADSGAYDGKSEWYILAVAQHNGLPTRCLDWTGSPLIAAHFACGDEKYKESDGAIWCLNAVLLRDINATNGPTFAALQKKAWVYDTRLLEDSFQNLEALDQRAGALLLLWEPPSLDRRIANQAGLLSIMNGPFKSQNEFLTRYAKQFPDLVSRINITSSAKSEICDMLDQNNISDRTVFPDLPGLCKWLKRHYSEAW